MFAGAYGPNPMDYVIDQDLADLDRLDQLQGFLDPSHSRPNREKDSNQTLDGKVHGQDRREISVIINSTYSELIGESSQINPWPSGSVQ